MPPAGSQPANLLYQEIKADFTNNHGLKIQFLKIYYGRGQLQLMFWSYSIKYTFGPNQEAIVTWVNFDKFLNGSYLIKKELKCRPQYCHYPQYYSQQINIIFFHNITYLFDQVISYIWRKTLDEQILFICQEEIFCHAMPCAKVLGRMKKREKE